MMKCKCEDYGPTVLRIGLGLLMFIPGLSKLMNPSGIIGMLGGMGMPLPGLLGWLLIFSEVVLGLALILGYKVKYVVWPNFIVILVAALMVSLPNVIAGQKMAMISLLFHVLALASFVSLYFTGGGAFSLDKKLEQK